MLRRTTSLLAITSLVIFGCNGNQMTTDVGGNDAGADTHADITGTDHGNTDVPSAEGGDSMMMDAGSCGTGLGMCNPISNAGCPTGQACIIAAGADGGLETQCAPPGTGGYDAPCHTADGCMQGFACLGNPGTCVKLCCGPGDNATCRTGPGGRNGALCNVPIDGVSFYGCQAVTQCDWFAQDCPSGGNCQPTDMAGDTTCLPAGTGTDGAQCAGGSSAVNCARGYVCIQDMTNPANGFCRQVCDPSLGPTDDAGTTPDGGVSRRCATGTCNGVMMRPSNYGVCIM